MTVGTRPGVDLDTQPIDQLTVTTIRVLAMDAVQAANSGHPGTPMALAPVGYALWARFLRFDPELPVWANRDRFVLSAGHASTLLYALLHLSGVKSVNPDYETVGTPAVTLLPVGLAYLARYAFNSELIFAIGLAVAAIIGGVK